MLAGAEAAPPEGLGPLQPTPPIGSPRVPGCYARPGTHIMLQPCPVPANQMVQEHLLSFSAMGAGSDSPKPSALPSLKLGGQPPKGTLDSYTSRPTTAAQSATSSGTPTPASMSGSAVTSSIGGGSGLTFPGPGPTTRARRSQMKRVSPTATEGLALCEQLCLQATEVSPTEKVGASCFPRSPPHSPKKRARTAHLGAIDSEPRRYSFDVLGTCARSCLRKLACTAHTVWHEH